MNIGIYQTVNSHAPAIHWWLAHDPRFGPQLYEGKNPCFIGKHIGSLVEEIRGNPVTKEIDQDMDPELYDIHQESLREMENKDAINNQVDCTSAYFEFNKQFQYPVWSNYFGSTFYIKNRIKCDKLIFAESTTEQSAFFYITQYAFNKIDVAQVNDHSEIWWKDHMLMGGNDIGRWKEVWYKDYHNQCIADCHSGKLQYMWQLNFAHWDLFEALNKGSSTFKLDYSVYRLFEKKLNPSDIEGQQSSIRSLKENNADHLLVDIEWFNNTDIILDYLGISNSAELIKAAEIYSTRYYSALKEYERIYNKYYINKGN